MSRTLSIDIETYSTVDIGSCGSYRYISDDSFEILLVGYAFDDDPVTVIDLTDPAQFLPLDFRYAIFDPDITKTAWNCAFERTALGKYFGMYCPPEQWEDTMILSAYNGYPLSLEAAGKALGMGDDLKKDAAGKRLIKFFSVPCAPTKTNGQRTRNLPEHDPDGWAQYIEYNRQDVVAERAIRRRLESNKPNETEHLFWCLDARINEHGVRVDPQLVEGALEIGDRYKQELMDKALGITKLDNPNSVAQVKAWLQEQEGFTVTSLAKRAVAEVVTKLETPEAKEFMEVRAELSKTSTSKYLTMQKSANADDHIRGCFQFYGAHTGRFAGRLVQLQNLPQNHMPDLATARALVRANDYETVTALYDNVTSTLSELIRTALIPEDGCRFIVSDYSAIEARVTAWLAGEKWRMELFHNNGDIYCASASQMFHVPVEKHGVNGHLRQKGKVAELALGYGGGIGAMKAFGADKMGMSDEDIVQTIDLWRQASPRICQLWKLLERAFIKCVGHHQTTVARLAPCIIRFDYDTDMDTVWMTLPSGRRMAYAHAQYSESTRMNKMCLSYMVLKTGHWERVETWGGKLTENLVQATARDCLRDAMLALDAEGYDIRAHVHDEVIINEPIGGRTVEDVAEIMGRPLSWAPGLPLRGDGYETPFYRKD